MNNLATLRTGRDETDSSITGSIARIEATINRLSVVDENVNQLWGALTGSGETSGATAASKGPEPVQPLQSRARTAAERLDVLTDRLLGSINNIKERIG